MSTLGLKRTAYSFNPSGNTDVQEIKLLAAKFIDTVKMHADKPENYNSGEVQRCLSLAMTYVETAQMYAVKGITKPKEDR